ncbi:hypothetical protein PCK1_000178, partial [Pneumocystis canis]
AKNDKTDHIISALSTVYSINTSKTIKDEAQKFLDEIKKSVDSWKYGIELTSSKNVEMDTLRHFGLNLIEHSIQCNWNTYTDTDRTCIRDYMVKMCYDGVRDGISNNQQEAHYIKQKISQILSGIIKKDFIVFQDINMTLQNMFLTSPTARDISLNTLLNLIEDVFQSDNSAGTSKVPSLLSYMIFILCSSNVLKTIYSNDLSYPFKIHEDSSGWLSIFCRSIESYFAVYLGFQQGKNKYFSNIESNLTRSIIESGVLNQLCFALLQGNIEIKMISSECLYTLFIRSLSPEDELLEIIYTFFEPNNLNHLHIVIQEIFYQVQLNDLDHFDEKKYIFLKKIVETIVALGNFHVLNHQKYNVPAHLNVYLDLVIFTTKHPSLIVSSISQPFWIALLKSPLNKENAVISILPHLLDIISNRLIRYENAQQTSLKDSMEIKFLNYDIETIPEMHMFCGNYRRLMVDLIQIIFSIPTKECISYAQQHVEEFFRICSNFITNNQIITFSKKKTQDYLFYDSNFTFIESVLKGYKLLNKKDKQLNNDLKENLQSLLIYCFKKIINMDIKEPLILGRQIQMLVTFLCSLEEKEFLIPVLEKTISASVYRYPDNSFDNIIQTIRELREKCGQELLRLAMELSNLLWNIYPQLENIIYGILDEKSSENENTILNTFLLIISQKSNNTQEEKVYYFQYIITKLLNAWNKTKSLFNLSTFNGFFNLLGLQKITHYIQSKNVRFIEDLSTIYLDTEGKQLVSELEEMRKLIWPIRGFRKFADYHLKIISSQHNSTDYLLKLWEPIIDFVLPDIFNIIKHVHVLYSPDNWDSLVSELRFIVIQSISKKHRVQDVNLMFKDQFYDEISESENKIIKIAYDLGYFLQKNKEYCYMSIGLFSNFKDYFYKNSNLAQNIITSFFTDIKGLSLYDWSCILDFSISPLVINCPLQYQTSFLKVLLPYLFTEIDKKLVLEWSVITEKSSVSENDFNSMTFCKNEDLSNEIIEESFLRHLSFITTKILRNLLVTSSKKSKSMTDVSKDLKIDSVSYVLQDNDILKSLLPLLLHLIMFHDTRTSHNAVYILQNIIPIVINHSNIEICTFITNDLFKACLMAINDIYLTSVHHDIITILIQIYTLAHERGFQQSKEVLLSIETLDLEKIHKFETELFNVKTFKSKKIITVDFLSSFGIKPEINKKNQPKKTFGINVNTHEIIKHFDFNLKISDTYKKDIFEQEENIQLESLFE